MPQSDSAVRLWPRGCRPSCRDQSETNVVNIALRYRGSWNSLIANFVEYESGDACPSYWKSLKAGAIGKKSASYESFR